MKKALVFTVVIATGIAGFAVWSSQPYAADLPKKAQVTPEPTCHYPDDLDCPLSAEQKKTLDTYHPVSQEALDEMFPEKTKHTN